ncbi:Reticulocyte-binding protein 2-like protein a [Lasiodiplodia theobromae]|uniref:Reticulocyte-binding protein 2-like protein a n=1 Tax=Lasiodiplodia theobromae TaxID=45133 RepID=A0A5N5DE41_9PEZI|nr:Reticulocyte-binding protein 2-like protein a [Lasiodiplodia theobromae]
MPARKRGRQEVEQEEQPRKQEPTKLEKLRNTWEFASLVQYIYIFGSVVKIDEDIDVDELEAECLKPTPSEKLAQIGLALLKYVSSHKGLTLEIFDEYARRQYVAKAPQRNPFGVDEEPKKFNDMDTFTKVRILQQLSTWTLGNADRIREKMPEQKDIDQTSWRVEAFGWDKEDRTYFVLDDDRLYRRTDPPLPAAPPQKSKPKSKAKPKKTKGTRASKRRRLSTSPSESDAEQEEDGAQDAPAPEEDTFGGMTWECVAVTLEDYTTFVDSIRKSRDPNEKELVKRLQADVIPIIEKRAEQQRQKALRKQRELENLEKLANAKRSSRIAGRLEKQKEQEAAVEAERKRVSDLEMAKKEQEKQKQMEEARQSRMMTREQRLKEREVKRILHEEELKKLQENSEKAENNEMRMSERHLKAEMERRQKELEQMAQEEENWIFDCAVCGVHGENLDDGSHSIACEKCNVWQHSACHGIAKATAERDDFHFVCSDCKQKAEDAARPKLPPLKFKHALTRSTSAGAIIISRKCTVHSATTFHGQWPKWAPRYGRFS